MKAHSPEMPSQDHFNCHHADVNYSRKNIWRQHAYKDKSLCCYLPQTRSTKPKQFLKKHVFPYWVKLLGTCTDKAEADACGCTVREHVYSMCWYIIRCCDGDNTPLQTFSNWPHESRNIYCKRTMIGCYGINSEAMVTFYIPRNGIATPNGQQSNMKCYPKPDHMALDNETHQIIYPENI